ncbi:cutinase family protein [Cellulomonas sp. PhB150]|uniref:cutinase family protein n=1 Tax=Cellulomonas sp. PhB150 TaxID=2485188 RepID=UPI000FAF6B92|nr:cutinase family protein [Cellulomonas sp. PhB150]ROS31174.1 cutinase [Cellulomonas sp. PhB150]
MLGSTRRSSTRTRTTLIVALCAVALLPLAAAPAQATVSSKHCASVVVIGVRGSYEKAGTGSGAGDRTYANGGFGTTSGAAYYTQSLSTAGVRTAALKYPASIWPSLPMPGGYVTSMTRGRYELREELEDLATCSSATRVVLVGYSQGAHIIGDTLSKGQPIQLSATAKARIKAVVLFGDPTYRAGESFNSVKRTRSGMFPRGAGQLAAFASRIRSYCYAGDRFCQNVDNADAMKIHTSYDNITLEKAAATFIRSKL